MVLIPKNLIGPPTPNVHIPLKPVAAVCRGAASANRFSSEA
jgi:hypothetical protein